MIFRISQKLGKKIKFTPTQVSPELDNPFADWSAHLFTVQRAQYIIVSNTKSLYSIIIPGQGITDDSTFIDRAFSTMSEFLKSDGFLFQFERFIVPEAHTVVFSKNANKAVIGSMNDLIFQAQHRLTEAGQSPHDTSIGINDTLLSMLQYGKPKHAFMAMQVGDRRSPDGEKMDVVVRAHNKPRRQRMPRFTKVMQFRVDLLDTCPQIWRRFQVPDSYSFWDLHCAITDSFGWKDYHLHVFKAPKPGSQKPDTIGIPDDEGYGDIKDLPGWKVLIKDYFAKEGDRVEYVYDFGDNWIHSVIFEGLAEAQGGVPYPICLDGAMAGPPEDCGGISGYERFKAAIKDPSHLEHNDMRSWVGGSFDPNHFDAKAVHFLDPARRYRVAFCSDTMPEEWE